MKIYRKTESLKSWVLAIRPRTLPAALSPVVVGTAMALADKSFRTLPALAALAGALLLQIAVNLANDYFDYKKGVDSDDRLGPVRVTQSGMLSPNQVMVAIFVTLAMACLIGLYLIFVGGWPILVVGGASILAALAYSGGPCPLGSHGLGDLLVFIFFGLVAVCGTYYVQTLTLTWFVVVASVPMGLLITAILVVNNLRDLESDRRAGKRTLAVILGKKGSKIEYLCLMLCSYLIPLILVVLDRFSLTILLPWLSLPLALRLAGTIFREEGRALNRALPGTAQLTLIYSLLFSLGIVLSR